MIANTVGSEPSMAQQNEDMVYVDVEVLVNETSNSSKYWAVFTSHDAPGWMATYYGRMNKKGKATIKHQGHIEDEYVRLYRSKQTKGYVVKKFFTFAAPEKLVKRTKSTNTSTGLGGETETATETFLQIFFNKFHDMTGEIPPCGSPRKGFVTEGDGLRKAAEIESVNMDPLSYENYIESLDYWQTWSLLKS